MPLDLPPNATLKIYTFEARHGREAHTVLRNLTKKPTLQNLNWDRVLKQKSAYLGSTDPRTRKFLQPMATDWEERSDIEYDAEHMNHHRRLAQEQLVSAAEGTSMVGGKQAVGGRSKQPSKRTELLFQRLKDSNKRYRPVNQKVVSESKHTLTLANGSVLRKSGVAGKVIRPNAPKISDKLTIPPPTMSALKQRSELKRAQEGQTAGTSARSTTEAGTHEMTQDRDYGEETDSDSEYEPLRISKYAGQNRDTTTTVEHDRGDNSKAQTASTEIEGVAGNSNRSGVPASKGVNTETQTMGTGQGGCAPNLNNEPQPGKQAKKKGEQVRRQRLVSYSSQDSQDSNGAGSRKSTRKRTAVSKFGGVMIDSIFKTRKNRGEEDKERDTA